MSAAAIPHPPVVPPRPSRSQDKDDSSSIPKIPPRPVYRRIDRSSSPSNPDRFAPSPLNESLFPKSPRASRFIPPDSNGNGSLLDPIARPASVSMPSVGEEGAEYEAVNEEHSVTSPEHTSTVAHDLKLHAPKPSLPAQSAKQRVATVTRTDSDRAAAFGIGRPSSEEPGAVRISINKKASVGHLSGSESHYDEEHGIPEIGLQVPMYPNAGDVQAPSPAPAVPSAQERPTGRHHSRKPSGRGFNDLPPGSYGLHGHGVVSQDKLEKAYYEKHPDVLHKEIAALPLHDPQNDFALSSNDLNKIVRDTVTRSALGTGEAFGAPDEEVAYQAHDEIASRMSSPHPTGVQKAEAKVSSPLSKKVLHPSGTLNAKKDTIHVDEPTASRRASYVSPDDIKPLSEDGSGYSAPILAEDDRICTPFQRGPAVNPPMERSGSIFEIEDPPSRPTSRPASIYKDSSLNDLRSTPLEDVQEYEPLFPEVGKDVKNDTTPPEMWKARHKFPSKDVWEDAPASVHYSAEVSTPDIPEDQVKPEEAKGPRKKKEETRTETPAAAFARKQEELAEKEARNSESFLSRDQKITPEEPKPKWVRLVHTPPQEARLGMAQRFPSKDIWEDVPESHLYETTVSGPQVEPSTEYSKLPGNLQPTTIKEKPAIPERPKPKSTPSDDGLGAKPPTSDKPKPQVPVRPAKSLHSGSDSREADASSKPKPAVPVRPVGGKIAALQAGFMSDLNKRLQLGPQAPKKEETTAQDPTEEKEKLPLSDARKGRARGPQRRAPAASSPSPAPAAVPAAAPALSFSTICATWSVHPDDGILRFDDDAKGEPKTEKSQNSTYVVSEETKEIAKEAQVPEAKVEIPEEALEASETKEEVGKEEGKHEKAEATEADEEVQEAKEAEEEAEEAEE